MFKRWNDFAGKSNLKEFWMPVVLNILISAIFQALVQLAPFFNYIYGIYGLILLIPFLALNFRRLHDVGKTGWYLLWYLLPIIGWILVIIQLAKPSKA
jgi:uncharacterized membrane protein YhaH (DUF805 family)